MLLTPLLALPLLGPAAGPTLTGLLPVSPQEDAAGRHVDGSLVEVTYLANAGFLIRSGVVSVLIDGFVTLPHEGYEALQPETRKVMLDARKPFDGYTVVLTSHVHADHFRPRLAERFLRANRRAFFGAGPEVITALAQSARRWELIKDRAVGLDFQPGELLKTFDPPGVDMTVTLFELPHVGTAEEGGDLPQNIGHLIRFDQFKVLHLGDAAVDASRLEQLQLAERDIDLAFIPYWFYGSPEGVRIIDEVIRARRVATYHFPVAKKAELIETFEKENPQVLLFRQPMERLIFDSREQAEGGGGEER